ncbi:hypothetical protein NX059_008907 [Plenodomus lindquistii]|nr:hypothetical protein NX059_008907 [Plenodomus lindquistii]
MAKPKPNRMSDLFNSSTSKPTPTPPTATPPYTSDGPTLPLIAPESTPIPPAAKTRTPSQPSKKRKNRDQTQPARSKGPQPKPAHTLHPALYTPWVLLPPEMRGVVEGQAGIHTASTEAGPGPGKANANANVVPIVLSKNQNIKAGINKLKILLGAERVTAQSLVVVPACLKEGGDEGAWIAVSAQGAGTGKLVGILEMVGRIVGGVGGGDGKGKGQMRRWYVYTVLSSVESEWPPRKDGEGGGGGKGMGEEEEEEGGSEEEEEAFESLERDKVDEVKKVRKIPVLTVWLTRKRVGAFAEEFGEQSWDVLKAEEED